MWKNINGRIYFIFIIRKIRTITYSTKYTKETSIEEIQSFFYRSILCEYNTLFLVEITKSFSDFQYSDFYGIIKMYTYIDKLLSYKYEESKKEIENIDKLNTNDYLNSCIVFIYDGYLENSFFNELQKYSKQKLKNMNM